MPEAFAVLLVFAISIAIYGVAWLRSRNPSLINIAEDLQRLRHHEGWLRERLQRAQLERWEPGMITSLDEELHATAQQLARLSVTDDAR